MPAKGIKKTCPHCGEYGRRVTREPVASRPGKTFFAASCLKCGRSDRTQSKFARAAVLKCRGFAKPDFGQVECGEPLMLAEFLSYDGRCLSCAHAHDEISEEVEANRRRLRERERGKRRSQLGRRL